MFVSNFLMIFYTDVFGISMAAVSALMAQNKGAGKNDRMREGFRCGMIPVSYTHLDVYKRQH